MVSDGERELLGIALDGQAGRTGAGVTRHVRQRLLGDPYTASSASLAVAASASGSVDRRAAPHAVRTHR